MPDKTETNQQILERLGLDRVRIMINTGGLPQGMMTEAVTWVAQRNEEERLRNESSQALQLRAALRSKTAAWIAAFAAIIGAILAAIGIVIALK